MTDPMDPIEHRLRDALAARADSVEPEMEGIAAMTDPTAARRTDLLRNRWIIGMSAAAALLVGAIVAAAVTGGDGGKQRVNASEGDTTTTESTPTTPTTSPATTVVATTTPGGTTVAPTTTDPGDETTTTAPPTTTTTAPPPPVLPGATLADKSGPATGDAAGLGTATLTDLRTGRQDGFDRVVLQFKGNGTPEWKVSYVDPPFDADGSGEPVAVDGKVFIKVRMFRASGYDFETDQVAYKGPKRVPGSGTDRVTEVVETGDFEGVMTWIIGLDSKVPFKVQTLGGPSRLVIDISHNA